MKVREIRGEPVGLGVMIGIAVSDFNATITDGLLAGAIGVLEQSDVEEITIVRVPGALELGVAIRHLIDRGCDGVIAVGAVIEGETDHYHHVATQTSAAISQLGFDSGVPVANAVLTVRSVLHARDRSGPGPGNKGAEAAETVLTTVVALRRLGVETETGD